MPVQTLPLVDSHCHLDRLNLEGYDDGIAGVIARARQQGVGKMLCVGIDLENSLTCSEIASTYSEVVASVGVHPLSVDETPLDIERLRRLADSKHVVAIGETGLDYFYESQCLKQQRQSFVDHLVLAKELRKPVIVHTRDAKDDTIELITGHGCLESAGVLHCFTEDLPMAKKALDLNYYISISGIVTFRNADALRDVVKALPLDRLLIETDSPYLTPMPHRGKPNEPQYVSLVAQYIADLLAIDVQVLAEITTNNFYRLFGSE
ncbi:putative metal-dependent hydrolase YcfH [Sinobacterium norvegicum]|uniref:Metal-dependent hydrolase YcfH n=1 Tax=Sinobacterium norvegicum TaxID=1641715 RepID=A0ABM9AA97_9GAMM|nr:TatD family hydrolase [Sinobacterium norvegicum]CAH0990131.1 putative metal-dependent hydrolase YcfH [Sinobacterium norvegicum]